MVIWAVFLSAVADHLQRRASVDGPVLRASSNRRGSRSSTWLIVGVAARLHAVRRRCNPTRSSRSTSATAASARPPRSRSYIPHAALLVGFSMMALAVLVRIRATSPASSSKRAPTCTGPWSLLPFVLLLFGFPIFLLLLVDLVRRDDLLLSGAAHRDPSDHLQQPQQVRAARGAVLHLRRRSDVARRHLARGCCAGWRRSIGGVRGSMPMTSLGFAALFGAISGVTTAATAAVGTLDLSAHARGRLQRALLVGADHRRRRARQSDPAVDRHDHLRHRRRHLDHRAVRRRHRTGPAAGRPVRRLHLLSLGARAAFPTSDASRSASSCWRRATASGRSARSASSSAASIPACSRRPRRPASPASTPSS